jgi:hypothetical protein
MNGSIDMIVLNRNLTLKSDGDDVIVPINIHQPVEDEVDWKCEFEIGWPTGVRKGDAFGVDAVQAVLMAMQGIGVELYTSDAHKSGKLAWLEQGAGYGLPVPPNARDLYEGDDKWMFPDF